MDLTGCEWLWFILSCSGQSEEAPGWPLVFLRDQDDSFFQGNGYWLSAPRHKVKAEHRMASSTVALFGSRLRSLHQCKAQPFDSSNFDK